MRHDADADRGASVRAGRRRIRGVRRPGPAAAQPELSWPDVGGLITRRWFAVAAAAALAVTDFPDWQAPQAHADASAATGVPLIRNITVLRDVGPFAPNTVSSVFHWTFSPFYEGYLIELIPVTPGAKIFAADVVIQHLDASGNVVGIEQVTLSNYQNAGNNTSIVRGRLLGNQIGVQVQVASSGWINGVTGSVVTADSINVRICGLQTYVPGTGKRVPVIQSSDGLLLESSFPAALTAVIGNVGFIGVLPDYTGSVVVNAFTTAGGGFTYAPRIDTYAVFNGTSPLSSVELPNVANNAPVTQLIALPSGFNTAVAVNKAAVAGNAGYSVVVTSADQ